jgi:hypothetical protein
MGAAATVSATDALWLSEDDVAVIVTVAVAAAAALSALKLMDCGVPGVKDRLDGVAETPAGRPLRVTLIVPVKPFNGAAETCRVCAVPPAVRLRDAGVTVKVKSGGL